MKTMNVVSALQVLVTEEFAALQTIGTDTAPATSGPWEVLKSFTLITKQGDIEVLPGIIALSQRGGEDIVRIVNGSNQYMLVSEMIVGIKLTY